MFHLFDITAELGRVSNAGASNRSGSWRDPLNVVGRVTSVRPQLGGIAQGTVEGRRTTVLGAARRPLCRVVIDLTCLHLDSQPCLRLWILGRTGQVFAA
jgi:hypothetical protein